MSRQVNSINPERLDLPFGRIVFGVLLISCSFFYSQDALAQKARSNRVKMDFSTDPGAPESQSSASATSSGSRQRQVKVKRKTDSRPAKTKTATRFTPLDREYDYAKPPYFGHKRPVVIRPIGQQKLCRVCGIIH